MNTGRFDLLAGAFIEGTSDGASHDELDRLLAADPDLRARFLELAEIHRVLEQELRDPALRRDFARRVREAVARAAPADSICPARRPGQARQRKALSPPRVRRFSWALRAAAAVLLAGAGLAWWGLRGTGRGSATVAARTLEAGAGVRVRSSAGTWAELKVEDELRVGDQVETGEKSRAKLAWAGQAASVELSAQSSLVLRNTALSFLERGQLAAAVTKRNPDDPFAVETVRARATVMGTRFELRAAKDSTRLEVLEGLVRFQRLDLPVSLEVGPGGYALAGPGITLAANARQLGTEGALRAIEDHEGPLAWQQSPFSAQLAIETSSGGHGGAKALRAVYEPKAGDRWPYGAIDHPFTLKPGDHALRFFIKVERFEGNANWNIQVRQRDMSCWFFGGGLFRDLGQGWNLVELEIPREPANAYGGGAYLPAEVQTLIFSVCQRAATFAIDDFEVLGEARP